MNNKPNMIVKYQIPAVTDCGDLLQESRFEFDTTIFDIPLTIEQPNSLEKHTLERIASATRAIARQLGLRRAAIGLKLHFANPRLPFSTCHCSNAGNIVINMTLTTAWRQTITFELLRSADVISGRFPSMHPATHVPWVDLLWSMSLAGRVEARYPAPENDQPTLSITSRSDGDLRKSRSELIHALIWKGKHEGLTLTLSDAQRIADRLWGETITLKEIVEIGTRYGFRLIGPLASTPMTETWTRPHAAHRQVAVEHAS